MPTNRACPLLQCGVQVVAVNPMHCVHLVDVIPNPSENKLPQGLPEERLREAVARSGYPLQSVVAAELQKTFAVTEEWGFPDRTTHEHRTLDIFAFKKLPEENRGGLLVAPSVALLIECKQSALPYVFFRSVVTEWGSRTRDFPTITGLQRLEIHAGDRTRETTPSECLGLSAEPFVAAGPPVCASLAAAAGGGTRKEDKGGANKGEGEDAAHHGKNIRLTGSEAYNSTLLPLIGATEHLRDYYRSATGPLHPTVAFAVCVLDAPMVLSDGGPQEFALLMVPWVRVVRQEKIKHSQGYLHRQHVIDFVHRFALPSFVGEVLGFASVARERLIDKGAVFQRGHGTVADLDGWTWTEVQPR